MKINNNFTIQEISNFWDSAVDEYDDINNNIGDAHYQRYLESIKYLNLKSNNKILNIWSRTGNAIKFLNKENKNLDIYNLEVSPKFIEKARKKFPDAKFDLTDLENLNFSDNHFDAILSLETLEHTPNPQKLVNEFYRVLKPGSRLVMSLPPSTAEPFLKIYNFLFTNHGEGPHKFLASKTVKKIISDSGFKLILHKADFLFPLGPKFLQNFVEKIINKLQKIFRFISEFSIRQFYVCEK